MAFLYIIRHAESEANIAFLKGLPVEGGALDSPVSERGFEQIKKLRDFLEEAFRGKEVICFTSPLQRAIHTSKSIEREVNVLEELREIRDVKNEDVTSRIYKVIDIIHKKREEYPNRPVVLFTHSLFINALVTVLLGEGYNRRGRFDGIVRYYTGNTGITALYHKGNSWRLLAHNYLHHLPTNLVSGTPLLLMSEEK